MKEIVAAFNQEMTLVGVYSVIILQFSRRFVCSSNILPVRCAGQHRGCARHEQVAAEVGHGRVRGGAAGARRDGERGAAGGGRLGGEDEDERSVLRPRLPAVRQRHHLRQQVPAGQVSLAVLCLNRYF